MKNEQGFTLIEMMIVLIIISVLLVVTIPNIAQHRKTINEKGCQAYIKLVEAQIQAYKIDTNDYPASLDVLKTDGYLKNENNSCPEGTVLTIGENGQLSGIPNEES